MVNAVVSILKKLVALSLLVGLVGVVAYAMAKPEQAPQAQSRPGRGGGSASAGGAPLVPVLAASAERTDVPVMLEGVGTVRPLSSVTVRPEADGRLIELHFREGQDVKTGDLLAVIEPAPYKAALESALARRAVTAVQFANAQRDYERLAKIPGVVAQKTVDTQRALSEQLEAQLKADDAAISTARNTLGYTRITAPISGRTGIRLVDQGNLVRSGDAGIVTITTIDPIIVLFTLPQQRLGELLAADARGAVPVEALDGETRRPIVAGTLDVIDNQIDQTTGTIRLKAKFANPKRELWPGQFVNVRVRVATMQGVVSVPTIAVQRGPAGTFVWLVGPQNAAVVRPVETGLTTETTAVVTKGLEAGEQVVTTGFARISEGARLIVRGAPASTPVSFAPPPKAKRGERAGKGKGKRREGAKQEGAGGTKAVGQ